MSWRRLLAVAYALLVEGLDADSLNRVDQLVGAGDTSAPTRGTVAQEDWAAALAGGGFSEVA